jgi:uncharacterized membrane protein AbrB (regulator of aidB expression)
MDDKTQSRSSGYPSPFTTYILQFEMTRSKSRLGFRIGLRFSIQVFPLRGWFTFDGAVSIVGTAVLAVAASYLFGYFSLTNIAKKLFFRI